MSCHEQPEDAPCVVTKGGGIPPTFPKMALPSSAVETFHSDFLLLYHDDNFAFDF